MSAPSAVRLPAHTHPRARAAGRRMLVPIALASACLMAGSALAIDQELQPQEPYVPATPEAAPAPSFLGLPADIAFGLALTTDYVSRGITNSDSNPAIQGYIEPSIGPVYLNVWSSNVDYGDGFDGAEIDTALGLRHSFGPASVDFGYVHYFYAPEDVSPDYGELYGKVDFDVNEFLSLGARVYFAPDYNQSGDTGTFVAGGAKVHLPYDFSVYGGVGYQFFEDPDASEQLAWMAGASYSWKALTFDLRYWDTDLSEDDCVGRSGFGDGCDARIVGTVSVDTSWSSLSEIFR